MMASSSGRKKVDRSTDEDPVLPKHHNIFLSHSGAQKEFVEQLCVDLESRHRFPFFDKRSSSLPKGESFPNHIKAAVAQCKMMVVVVSEEYFTSKWPMIELNGFVQASKTKANLKKILPLFYGLNVKEFSESERQKKWFTKWEEMAKADHRIKVDEWKESLERLRPFYGLVYDRNSKEVVAYRKEIVSNICEAIPSSNRYDESHVQGRSKLCQVICGYLENTPNSTKFPGVRVIGLYGVGGMGKTEICKMMCNKMDGEFDGKVCHVELGKQSKHKLVKKVLTTLTNTSVEVVQEVGKDKCEDVLLNKRIWTKKSFLTIDNVWDDSASLEQGKLYLRAPFVEGSWVIITSRFKKTLRSLQVDENACFEMPELDKDDARRMFLYHAPIGKGFEQRDDLDAIEKCIQSCYFRKGDGQRSHYHPLSLKALGVFLQHGGKEPFVWMKNLQKLKELSYLQHPKNPLFDILRMNYDRLLEWEQELFMDVALFYPPRYGEPELMEWLCLVHKNKEKEEIEDGLEHLVESALLEHAEMRSWEVSIHDLYLEFARLEAQGKLMALDMEKRRWVYAMDAFPPEMEDEPRTSWKKLTRVCILETLRDKMRSGIWGLSAIEWKYCRNLVVLKLNDMSVFSGVLNLKDLKLLRSLSVVTSDYARGHKFSIEGLEGLRTLTYFYLYLSHPEVVYVGKLPAALKVLVVSGRVEVEGEFLALCTNLVSLTLSGVPIADLDLKSCTSLEKVYLEHLEGLKVLELGPTLQTVGVKGCWELVDVCGLDRLLGLLSFTLVVHDVNYFERDTPLVFERDVLALWTNLVSLELNGVDTSELDLKSCTSLEKVQLDNIDGLEVLELGPSLQTVGVTGCPKLVEVCGLDRLLGLLSLTLVGTGYFYEWRDAPLVFEPDVLVLWLKVLELGPGLQTIKLSNCLELVDVCGLDRLLGLLSLTLVGSPRFSKLSNLSGLKRLHTLVCHDLDIDEVPGLDGLVGLISLTLRDSRRLSKLPSLTGLHCLRELIISGLGITEIPNLSGLEQLEVVDASRNRELTSLQGFGDSRALKHIKLRGCESLCRLSDMSKLTNLEHLDLGGTTRVELHEEDIHMLQGLHALESILFGNRNINIDLDFSLVFKGHRIMITRYISVHGRLTTPYREIDLRHPSVAAYLVGKRIGVPELEYIWSLMF